MSSFLGLAPAVRIRVRNVFLDVGYPSEGSMEAVVDTGYEGFLAIPQSIFEMISFGKMKTQRRIVQIADGRKVRSRVAYGTVELIGTDHEVDGLVETFDGLNEALVGGRLLSHFRVTLDYCLRTVSIRQCS